MDHCLKQPPGFARRRLMCRLDAESPAPAAIRTISGRGAFLETNARPHLGEQVTLRHPSAGAIAARVSGLETDGISVAFILDARSTGFALAVIASGMHAA